MADELRARVAKAFRVRGPRARDLYVRARRVSRYFRDRERRQLASLSPNAVRIPEDVGYVLVPPGVYQETADVVAEARGWLDAFRPDEPVSGKNRKRFLQNVLSVDRLTPESPVIRLALREDLLATVAAYLGVAPVLSATSVFLSAGSDAELVSSQLYHCDGDDVRQVKVFVYCSDVTPASGPLTVLDAASSAKVVARTHYHFRSRLADPDVHAVVGTDRERPILGATGTTVLVDTSRCLHFGSRVGPGAPPRLAVMIQYQTPYSFMLPGQTRPFAHLATGGLRPLQRLALTD